MLSFNNRARTKGRGALRIKTMNHNVAVGKYLVSPLTKRLDDGRYAASVSIRSGRGSGMHDRIMRFTPLFACNATAASYATEQGLSWVHGRAA